MFCFSGGTALDIAAADFLQARCPFCRPTNGVKAPVEFYLCITFYYICHGGFSLLLVTI